MGRGNTSAHMQSLGGTYYSGYNQSEKLGGVGKRDDLIFLLPLQIKCNNKGGKVLSALCLSHLLPASSWDLTNWVGQEKVHLKKKAM